MTSQSSLFDHPMARKSDHDSSHVAADRVEKSGLAKAQRESVYALVQRYPGSTSREIATLGKIDRYIPGRRLSELEREGAVQSTRIKGQEIRWWPST